MKRVPAWWSWELEISPHTLRRMKDRGFSEVELRVMVEDASEFVEDLIDGRWVLVTSHGDESWEVIVQPQEDEKLLVVVTAFRSER